MTTHTLTSAYFARLRTSTEFATAIDDLTGKQVAARKRSADLVIAEDAAQFGDGNLAKVRADLKACDAEIEELEKQIEGCRRRRQEAAQNERLSEIEDIGRNVKAKAEALKAHWRRINELVEEMRGELFEVDALERFITQTNLRLDAAQRRDLMPNLHTLRREAATGPRREVPSIVSTAGRRIDVMLLSILGGRARQPNTGRPEGDAVEVKGAAHQAVYGTGN